MVSVSRSLEVTLDQRAEINEATTVSARKKLRKRYGTQETENPFLDLDTDPHRLV